MLPLGGQFQINAFDRVHSSLSREIVAHLGCLWLDQFPPYTFCEVLSPFKIAEVVFAIQIEKKIQRSIGLLSFHPQILFLWGGQCLVDLLTFSLLVGSHSGMHAHLLGCEACFLFSLFVLC